MRNALKYLTVAAMSACGPWSCAPAIPARTAPVAHPPRIVQSNNLVLEADAKDEPTFVQHPGQSQRTKLAEGVAAVLGRYATPKATYLLLRVKHEGTLAPTRLETLSDAAGRVVVGAVGGTGAQTQSVSTPEFDLILRITGPLASAGPTRINWVARRVTEEPGSLAGGYEQSLSLSGLAEAPTQRDLEARFGEAMAAWFDDFRQRDPFMTFAASRLVQRFVKGIPEPNSWRWRWHNPQVDMLDMMDFYTGRSTIRDSLQIERGMQLPRKAAPHTVDPSSIKIAPPRDRNYAQLVAKDSARSGPVLSSLSTVVPADTLVIEFASLKDVIQLPRLLDQKLGQILRVSEGSGGPNHLIERYRNQLAIELDGFAETVGQFAVRSVTVVLGDAYLREGTDFSLVFRAENQELLESVLANHLARTKLRRPDLQSKQERINGESVFVHTTADAAIRRYEYVNGDIRVLSNSRTAMSRLILVKQGKLPKLSDDKGYLGARSLEPFDLRRERAFVFFGDAFVANVVGPRSKILEARRMRAQAELQAVDHAALLFGWMEGRAASTSAELLDSGWLLKADLVHSDGSPISWSASAGAHSRWGYAQSLIPLAELPFDRVGKDEVSAYQSFRSRYDRDINGLLDPTSLRIERGTDEQEIHTELRVFPIMPQGRFNSDFREITRLVGAGRVDPGPITRGLGVTLAVGEGSPLRNLADETIHGFAGKRDLSISFVGDWVHAGLDEGSAIWDIAGHEDVVSSIASDRDNEPSRIDFDSLVPKLPVWIAVNIKSRLLLAAALTALRAKVEEAASGLVKWQKDAAYREVPVTRVRARASEATDAIQANVYYAIAKDVLIVSLRRDVLSARIDDVLDGRTPKGNRLQESPAQFALDLAPLLGGWLRRAASASLDTAALDAHEHACTGYRVLARGLGALPDDALTRRNLALRLLGYEPESPQGAAMSWHDGLCEDAIYGSAVDPRVPDANDPKIPLHALLSGIGTLRSSLGLVPRGNDLELWASFQMGAEPFTNPKPKGKN